MSFHGVDHVGLADPDGTATDPKTSSLAADVVPVGPEENVPAGPSALAGRRG